MVPLSAATAPSPIAVSRPVRNPITTWLAVATGTTIRALTSRSPTVRIETVTVIAARVTTRMLRNRTGRPMECANASSADTVNNWGNSPRVTTTTTTPSPAMTHRSAVSTMSREPNM